jgi:hypothetical protein
MSGIGRGGIFSSGDEDDSSFKSDDVSIPSSSSVSEHFSSPNRAKRSSVPFPRNTPASKRNSVSNNSSATANTFSSGVHVSKKKFCFSGVDGHYYAVTSILPSGLVTSNERNHLTTANSQLKSRIVDSKTGLLEILIPKPKAFFKSSTFKSKSSIISHFFGDDDKHFKDMIGSSFDFNKDLMNSMHSDVKIINLNDEIDENIKTKGCSYISSHGIGLYTILLKARDQKELSDDEGDIDLFACDSPSAPPPTQHSSTNQSSSAPSSHSNYHQDNSDNIRRSEAEQAFQAVAEQLNRSHTETRNLARDIEFIRSQLEEVAASSPSPSRRRKVSCSAPHASAAPQTPSSIHQPSSTNEAGRTTRKPIAVETVDESKSMSTSFE